MYQNLVRNEYGEPMYFEEVLDPQEQEEAYWEEMQHRADDPWYAAQCEKSIGITKPAQSLKQRALKSQSK